MKKTVMYKLRSVDKCSEVEWRSQLQGVYHYYKIYKLYEVCCLYGNFFYCIFSYSFGSILYHCTHVCMFCMLLFNYVQAALMYSYCYVCSVLGILFHCVVLCIVCV